MTATRAAARASTSCCTGENLDAVDAIIELGLAWGVDRIELANTQFYGWGLLNRTALLPTREQLARAEDTVDARAAQGTDVELVWVIPDYFDGVPKPCMGGWGAVSITVAPDGTRAALPGRRRPAGPGPAERPRPLRSAGSGTTRPAFNAYRGTDWMREPCASCPPQRARLRRLPLPGVRAHRRRRPHRPGLPAVTRPPSSGRAGRRRQVDLQATGAHGGRRHGDLQGAFGRWRHGQRQAASAGRPAARVGQPLSPLPVS